MTLIEDAQKLLDNCKHREDAIYDTISFCHKPEDVKSIYYLIERVPKMRTDCDEMLRSLISDDDSLSTTCALRHDLRRMNLKLDAAIMYANDYFHFD
jgi:hypothetical protein